MRGEGAAGAAAKIGRRGTLRSLAENLRLRAEEISSAAKLVNEQVEKLIEEIKKHELFRDIERLTTGSYYEGVKISKPDEFDIMLKIPFKSVKLEEFDCKRGAFYYVKFKRGDSRRLLFESFLDENKCLMSSKMLSELRGIIDKICKKNDDVSIERKKHGCPAVTLCIKNHGQPISVDIVLALEVQQKWPSNTTGGLKIEPWLGNMHEQFISKPFYLVPKQAKDGRTATETWRISFSHIEKEMLNNHGNAKTCCESKEPKCCRKYCLRLLKYLLQHLKQKYERKLLDFCSYHAKTTLLHSCVSRPTDDQWQFADLDNCFKALLDDFIKRLQERDLPHFFIPSFNLFDSEEIDSKSLDFLWKTIELERNNMLAFEE